MDTASSPAPTDTVYTREQFKTPPVVMRRFVTRLDVAAEVFEERALPIMEEVQAQGGFGQRQMKEQWEFRVELKGKVPRPKGRLTHSPVLIRAAEAHTKTVFELFPPVEGNPAEFIIEQDRSDESASRFEHLEAECQRWLPLVMERLDVAKVGGIKLEYRNEFHPDRYPIFWEGDSKLMLNHLLWLFHNNPSPGNFVTPLLVEFNLSTELQNSSSIRIRTETVPVEKGKFALAATLTYSSLSRPTRDSLDTLWPELTTAHDLLFQNFVRQFTDRALEEFAR